jgi:ABC-type transporter Mla subunit MlaD
MESIEFKALEEKTRSIVDTLENLEREIKEYQKKNVDIVSAIANLANVSEQVGKASKELSGAAALFSSSDFSKAMEELDKRIDKINEAEVVFTDQTKAINTIVVDVLAEYKNLSSDINAVNKSIREVLEIQHTVNETKQLLEMIVTKIDRIDRNTQKGFGKERG